jgi:hypothetical protein
MNKIIVLPAVFMPPPPPHDSRISLNNVERETNNKHSMNSSKGCAGLLGPEEGSGEV